MARTLLDILHETEEMPESDYFEYFDNSKIFVDMYEIDYRNPPQHWPHIDDPEAVRLIIINEDEVKPEP